MIHSRKKGAHIGWMLLLLLVLSMGIASVQASAAPVSTAAKSADGKIVTKGSDKYYRYKDGSYAKNTWIKIGKRSYYFLKSGRMAVSRMQKLSGIPIILRRTEYVPSPSGSRRAAGIITSIRMVSARRTSGSSGTESTITLEKMVRSSQSRG